jgi:predicted nuclease of predicted toxin-antitoxin system
MRFLANENVPGPVVSALRERGHDVVWIQESMAGADDPVVLALAQTDGRVVVTNDTDFGELAFRSALPAIAALC